MSHQAYDHVPQNFAHTDKDPGQVAFEGANKAFHDQLHTAVMGKQGFLDQADRALGGSGVSESASLNQGKAAMDQLNKKQEGIHNEALAFGLANDKDPANIKNEQARLSQTFRDMAFTSVYDSAINNPKNQSGFPGGEKQTARLDFQNSPHLNTNGSGQQLRWAS